MIPSSRPFTSDSRSGRRRDTRAHARVAAVVRRIEADLLRRVSARQRFEHARRAAAGVLVLVQPQPVVQLGRLLRTCSSTGAPRSIRRAPSSPSARASGTIVGASARETRPRHALHRHHAHEIGRAQAAAEPGGAGRRQHVIRSGGVVAGGLRGERPDEHRAGGDGRVVSASRSTTRCSGARRLASAIASSADRGDDDGAVRRERARARCRVLRRSASTASATRSASARLHVMKIERASGSCSACAIRSAAIHPAGREPATIDDLGRARRRSRSRSRADDERLRRRDVAVAGADDLVDARNRVRCRRPARRSRARRRCGTAA